MSSSPYPIGSFGSFKLPSAANASWRRSSTTDLSPSPPSPPYPLPWRRRSAPTLSTDPTSSSPPRGLPGVGANSTNWRVRSTPPPSTIPCLPSFGEVKAGTILFLPNTDLGSSRIHQGLHQDDEPWYHPVVVLGKFVTNGEQCVRIRTCTSFNNQRIEDAKLEHQRRCFLLVDNDADTEVHHGTRLGEMAPGSDRFSKRTYVNLSFNSLYEVEYKHLELFNGKPAMQLDEKTVAMVKNCDPCSSGRGWFF